jgi:hypothetical protein
MASGFIVLRDGRCLAVRGPIYDAVLRSIAAVMDATTSLHSWLVAQVPQEDDAELGHAFVRASDGTIISRHIDTRGLTESNRQMFDRAARLAIPTVGPHSEAADVASALKRLCDMLHMSDEGRPPLELSDWTVEAPACNDRVGPDWP